MCRTYKILGFDRAVGGDGVLRDLVRARIIEPSSKRVALLAETGVASASYRTIKRHLPACICAVISRCRPAVHRLAPEVRDGHRL